jgi:hypothetical protein
MPAVTIPRIAIGTWRYAAPLLLLTAVACLPFGYFALTVATPVDRGDAAKLVKMAWLLGGTAWMVRYVLVGAIAPVARAVASGRPLSQLAALREGARGLVRAALPCGLAIAAIVIGGLALAVPGLLLLVLLSMTGASERVGLPAPLLDSIEVARADLRTVAIVAGGMLLVDLAIVAILYVVVIDLPVKPSRAQLDGARLLIQMTALGMLVMSPVAASALAAIHARARS